jgi:HEPN domain-containing protein
VRAPPGTAAVERSRATVFLEKAEEFLRSAKRSLEAGDRDAAGMLAIHAGISACDALTVSHLGLRSNTQRHLDVLALLRLVNFDGRPNVERQLRELVSEKREVEYEDRRLQVGDAAKMVELAERVVTAVGRAMGKG